MATASSSRRPYLTNSPFAASPPEQPVEDFVLSDLVAHDSHGLGRVVGVDAGWVTVDFQTRTVRFQTPFRKITKL
jgi:hypothetical protein